MLCNSVVEGKGFEELAQYLEPEQVMPTRATVTKCIEKHFEEKNNGKYQHLTIVISIVMLTC